VLKNFRDDPTNVVQGDNIMEIRIRKFKPSDALEFQNAVLSSVQHISKWLPWCTEDYSIDNAVQWATSASDTWNAGTDYRFIIETIANKEVLGSVGINQIVLQHKVGNLGYWVKESAINQGVCTQAAQLAIRFAFTELRFRRIEIHVHPDNLASNKVASRLGGLYEGKFRNKLIHNGISVPAMCYSVIPSDYESVNPGVTISRQ